MNSNFEIENFILYNDKEQKLKGEIHKPAGQAIGRCVLIPPFGMSSLDLTSTTSNWFRNR